MKFRIYLDSMNSRKASYIVESKEQVETLLPKEYGVIVKKFNGKQLDETYLVSWMGYYFKWDVCLSEAE